MGKFKTLLALLPAIIVVVFLGPANAGPTGPQLKKLCESANATDREVCLIYLQGFADALQVESAVKLQHRFAEGLCIGRHGLSSETIRDVWLSYIRAHPKDLGLSVPVQLYIALHPHYRCENVKQCAKNKFC
jgi:hypothetical protein